MTLNDKKNNGLYNWYSIGVKNHTFYIHPFAVYKFDDNEANRIIKFISRR